MPRIVPGQVVAAIEQTYDWAKKAADGQQGFGGSLGPEHAPKIAMLLELLRSLPEELLPSDPQGTLVIEAAKGAMQGALASWSGGPHPGVAAQLGPSKVFGDKHPVVAVLLALRGCKDETAAADTPDLAFIKDEAARQSLRIDVATAYRAYGNGEYKAATVLAGAVVEAILLWRIKPAAAAALAATVAAHDTSVPSRKLASKDPDSWDLTDLIWVAAELKIIDTQTKNSCNLCREFRNLIHPGRVLRTGADASKATALAALAAMQKLLE